MAEHSNTFCMRAAILADDRIKLVPFQTWKHAPKLIKGLSQGKNAWSQLDIGPYETVEDFITTFLAEGTYKDDRSFTYAILDTETTPGPSELPPPGLKNGAAAPDDGELAGMVSLTNANPENRSLQIAHMQILPAFSSQGLASRIGRLLLQYGMTPPDKGGLGLARMEWHAATTDPASIKVARRLGFSEMGTVRYERLLKDGVARGKVGNGRPPPAGTAEEDLWRDTVMFGMAWDDWLAWEREDIY